MKLTDATIAVAIALALAWPEAKAAEFPDGLPIHTAEQAKQALQGKIHEAKLADGSSWRARYNNVAYVFFNSSQGRSDTGEWMTDVGRLCTKLQRMGTTCNEVRIAADGVLLRRNTGEIVKLVAR